MGLILILTFVVRKLSINAANDALKFDAISRSPINSLYASSLVGLATFRAYRVNDIYNKRF